MNIDRIEGVTCRDSTVSAGEATCNRDSLPAVTEVQKHPKSALPDPSVILDENRRRLGSNNSEKIHTQTKEVREYARRMIADGLMPLETVSRLAGMGMAMVHELAAEVAWKNKRC